MDRSTKWLGEGAGILIFSLLVILSIIFFLLIPREGVLELADLRWNSSVKKSMPRENPGEWKEIQAPKYDRYPGRIQGSEGVGDSK